ncbi:MAG: YxlC family protein [Bacillota bacterium]|nr:YxlC family protein [Bacillota bacterium]
MKKQRVISLDEQQNKKDLKVIHELQQGLEKVDAFSVYAPDLQWFEQMVLVEQQRIKKRFVKDLSTFIFVAVFILSGIMISLYHMPTLFIGLQIAATIFIGVYTVVRYVKKVNYE